MAVLRVFMTGFNQRVWWLNPTWKVGCLLLLLAVGAPLVDAADITSLTYGLPARSMTSTWKGNNIIPQRPNMVFTYAGTLAGSKWLSFIDATLNSGAPCLSGTIAAAEHDSGHSGVMQGSASKVVTVPQISLLDASKTFAICFAENSGAITDTWSDSRFHPRL